MSEAGEYLTFKKMITPIVIQVIFWILVGLCVIAGIAYIVMGAVGDSGISILSGLLTLILGPLFARVYCEIIVVMFRIYDKLTEINDKIK